MSTPERQLHPGGDEYQGHSLAEEHEFEQTPEETTDEENAERRRREKEEDENSETVTEWVQSTDVTDPSEEDEDIQR